MIGTEVAKNTGINSKLEQQRKERKKEIDGHKKRGGRSKGAVIFMASFFSERGSGRRKKQAGLIEPVTRHGTVL